MYGKLGHVFLTELTELKELNPKNRSGKDCHFRLCTSSSADFVNSVNSV
jgi:hypothetical protein